jgi:hypothetical protein
MIMGSSFDRQRGESPPILTSSGGGTPTPTSSSNSAAHPQVPTTLQQYGPSSWIKQQVQALGAHVLPSGTSHLISEPKRAVGHPFTNGHPDESHQSNGRQPRMHSLSSHGVSICANGVSREPRIRRESPDEGIQVESDV